jgi:hypothetical protein
MLQLLASRDCWPVVRSRGMACAALKVATRLLCARRDCSEDLPPNNNKQMKDESDTLVLRGADRSRR